MVYILKLVPEEDEKKHGNSSLSLLIRELITHSDIKLYFLNQR